MANGMRENRAQVVLLVRAFEEADPAERLLPAETRAAASRRAASVTGLVAPGVSAAGEFAIDETVYRRARLLWDLLARRVPLLPRLARVARQGSGVIQLTIVIALLIGLATNVLGSVRTINLLSFPLLGLLAWNLLVYVVLLVLPLTRGRHKRSPDHRGPVMRGVDLFVRFTLWRSLATWKRTGGAEGWMTRIVTEALVRVAALWHDAAGRLLAVRSHMLLHMAAVLVVAGAVAGMYLRGLAFEYRVAWESTLLGAAEVQTLLDLILGPAAYVLGVDVPRVAGLQHEGGAAAIWLHLYAVTALLIVGLPRTLLFVWYGWRAKRLAGMVPIDLNDPYYRRMLSEWRGTHHRIDIQPYSHTPSAASLDRLRTMLHDFYGARATLHVEAPLSYGEELPAAALPSEHQAGDHVELVRVALFNLAQSPETEVHGRVVEELKRRTEESDGKLLVLLDASGYGTQDPERLEERLHAWQRVIPEIAPVVVDLEHPHEDRLFHDLRMAHWPGQTAEVHP